MKAHKFGGSSVANAERMVRVVNLLRARNEEQVIVISAMQGVTDALLALVHQAARGDPAWEPGCDALEHRHLETAQTLLGVAADGPCRQLNADFVTLRQLLRTQALVGAESTDLAELISGLGEVFSSRLVAAAFEARGLPARWLDARDVLVVDKTELGAMVRWDESQRRLDALGPKPPRTVVTGFVARTAQGRATTLGRNGSDYSGAIFAALFGADELHLWSDVDGVLSADPRLVSEAVRIDSLSYAEACELAYFGAKVVHPQTMAPAFARNIPIIARSTFAPEAPGTRISAQAAKQPAVKGVTTFTGLAILNIEGAGMLGVPGTAERAFAALKAGGVSVVMISQGSSEHSICCVVRKVDADAARRAVRDAFTRELGAGLLNDVTVTHDVAALAIVGDGMHGQPGIAARLFDALGRAHVNVRVIAQGASERNISVAIDEKDATRALRAVHAGFYLSQQTLSVGLIGPGNVGQALLAQLEAERPRLLARANVDLRVRGVLGQTRMALADVMVPAKDVRGAMTQPADLNAFVRHVHAEHLPHTVLIDCSASDAVAGRYVDWLQQGIHVITPNKNAGAGPLERYQAIKRQGARFHYESTVGAGLPVITTLRDLLDTGDEVHVIEGIFSGTLAYLFNSFDGSAPFSELVRQAKALGYTEPDPRDDLSGLDVARKLVILARERGLPTTLEQVRLESLVPPALREVPLTQFLERLPELDGPMRQRLDAAKAKQHVLRYVARLDAQGPSVGLVELPQSHAFAHLKLTDNVVQFQTARYSKNPLVVQGPGAGPEVTAAGVFADLLRVATALGAKL